jgi:hypothetical protein
LFDGKQRLVDVVMCFAKEELTRGTLHRSQPQLDLRLAREQ